MDVWIYMSVYLSVSVSICLSLYMSVCLYGCMSVWVEAKPWRHHPPPWGMPGRRLKTRPLKWLLWPLRFNLLSTGLTFSLNLSSSASNKRFPSPPQGCRGRPWRGLRKGVEHQDGRIEECVRLGDVNLGEQVSLRHDRWAGLNWISGDGDGWTFVNHYTTDQAVKIKLTCITSGLGLTERPLEKANRCCESQIKKEGRLTFSMLCCPTF